MIMEWKKNVDGTYHAAWRGTQLMLVENTVTKRWHMLADDKLVRQNWPSARKAMNEIENRQQRIVVQLAAVYAATKSEGAHAVAST